MSLVQIVRRPAKDLALVAFDGDVTLWSAVRIRRRRPGPPLLCALSGRPIAPGMRAYSPVHQSKMYRAMRILAVELEKHRGVG